MPFQATTTLALTQVSYHNASEIHSALCWILSENRVRVRVRVRVKVRVRRVGLLSSFNLLLLSCEDISSDVLLDIF